MLRLPDIVFGGERLNILFTQVGSGLEIFLRLFRVAPSGVGIGPTEVGRAVFAIDVDGLVEVANGLVMFALGEMSASND